MADVTTAAGIPVQRTLTVRLIPLHFARGVATTTTKVHAVRRTGPSSRAVCDDSLTLTRLGGRFDYDDLNSCVQCIIETAARAPGS